jgi:predicted Fe-Mo cluster-binding NifX family protein
MKIAVASDDGSRIAAHTGRCAGFVIFETKGTSVRRIEHRRNDFTAHARGESHRQHLEGEPHSHAGVIGALQDCQALISRGMGPRLQADLAACGIESFLCHEESVDQAAVLYARGALARAPGTGSKCRHRA